MPRCLASHLMTLHRLKDMASEDRDPAYMVFSGTSRKAAEAAIRRCPNGPFPLRRMAPQNRASAADMGLSEPTATRRAPPTAATPFALDRRMRSVARKHVAEQHVTLAVEAHQPHLLDRPQIGR